MKCIILAGGRGVRMAPLTDTLPKPLIEIGGKPILYHIIDRLHSQGVNEFIVAGGYRNNVLESYIKRHPVAGTEISVVNTGTHTLTGGRLKKVAPPKEEIIVTYGDDISNVDIREVVKVHHEDKHPSITMTAGRAKSPWGHLKLGKYVDTEVEEFEEKPYLSDWINVGNWVIDSELCEYIRVRETMEQWCQRMLEEYVVNAYKYTGFFYGMNTYADYLYLNDQWEKHKDWGKISL